MREGLDLQQFECQKIIAHNLQYVLDVDHVVFTFITREENNNWDEKEAWDELFFFDQEQVLFTEIFGSFLGSVVALTSMRVSKMEKEVRMMQEFSFELRML